MSKKQTLTLLCGIPGSGKSTWLKKNAKSAVIVSPDTIRKDILGHQFHHNAEQFVWWLSESMVKILLAQGKSVIIDATNLFPFLRMKWGNIADEYKVDKEIVWMDTDVKECWRRNVLRKKKDRVPREAFDRMAKAFIYPDGGTRIAGGSIRSKAEATSEEGFKVRRIKGEAPDPRKADAHGDQSKV